MFCFRFGENATDNVRKQYEDMYIDIVDSFDEHTGIDVIHYHVFPVIVNTMLLKEQQLE